MLHHYAAKPARCLPFGPNTLFAFLLTLGLLLGAFSGQAQTAAVTGSVRSAAGAAIEFATVTLHRAADSAVVKTEFSDAQGAFRLEHATVGRYRVSASQVGFVRYWSEPFDLATAGVGLPAFALQTSAAT